MILIDITWMISNKKSLITKAFFECQTLLGIFWEKNVLIIIFMAHSPLPIIRLALLSAPFSWAKNQCYTNILAFVIEILYSMLYASKRCKY